MKSAHYARYYLGQRFWFLTQSGYEDWDVIVSVSDNGNDVYGLNNDLFFWDNKDKIVAFKLILKHVCDMPKMELKEYKALCQRIFDVKGNIMRIVDTPLSIEFLLSNGYDTFDLIESGEAFDAKIVNHKPRLKRTN